VGLMKFDFCPGSSKFRQPEPETIKCPSCSAEVEIWTDEIQATCPKCKRIVMREAGVSCLDWCRYAKECVGSSAYNNYMRNKAITIKQRLMKELEEYFGADEKRINHAKRVMQFAEEIMTQEKADWHIVIPASILHDIGIKESEKKYGSAAGYYQEKEGPDVARRILLKIGFKKEDIDEICEIIAHHHSPGKVKTQNFKVLYDSDWLVNLNDEVGLDNKDKLKRLINKVFLTKSGRDIAEKIYLKSEIK
jgi:HD superfamily phosphohydrolase YqeK